MKFPSAEITITVDIRVTFSITIINNAAGTTTWPKHIVCNFSGQAVVPQTTGNMSKATSAQIPDVGSDDELTISDQHRLLTSKHRRRVLDLLADTNTPIELENLASKVSMRGNDAVEDTLIRLHHVHLPMMSEMNVINYDPDTRIIHQPT